MSMPLTKTSYNASPVKIDNKIDEEGKLNKSGDSKGFSFKEFTKKFASADAAGMNSIVGKTGESQMKFAQDILLKQLQCQTPDNSFDPNQMMDSMMSMLNIAQNGELVSMQKENMELQKALFYTSLSAFEGEMVEHSGNQFDYRNQDQEIVFNLPSKVDRAILRIHDENNKCVKTVNLEGKVGRDSFVWDGKTDSGADAPRGLYTTFVTAIDDKNAPLEINMRLKSQITDIAYDENELAVPLSGRVPIYDIKRRTMINKATQRYQEAAVQTSPPMTPQASQLNTSDIVFNGSHI